MVNVFLSGTVSNTSVSTSGTIAGVYTGGSVGPVSYVVMDKNADRMGATFVNDGSNVVYLCLGGIATIGGIRLNAAGGSYEINSTNLFTGQVSAITSSGTTDIVMMESKTK